MDVDARLERVLSEAIARATAAPCPERLASALRFAVFPGGARVRPRLCYAVACALDGVPNEAADGAAVGLELLHCASLVHDDLPAFDAADMRRGRPTVHRAFGEAIAVLTGDALVMAAFEAVARAPFRCAAALVALLARAAGAPSGMVAGQAWESEPHIDRARYHHAKTAGLFEAATTAGAIAGGDDPAPWADLGRTLGEAYQIADDILDATSDAYALGKPVGKDESLGRPNTVRELGLSAASALLRDRVDFALASIPTCPCPGELHALVAEIAVTVLRAVPARSTEEPSAYAALMGVGR